MKNLQEKVQAMLDGETKRRETALKFINEVSEILVPVAKDIWGTGNSNEFENVVWLSRKEKDKREYTDIYFRYESHSGNSRYELEGFFLGTNGNPLWGKKVEWLKGTDFWSAIGIIMDWVPYVAELMDLRSVSREELLSKINL